ncbi:hypothetical protein S40288_09973, partial [Stachybotrys chartarum IBT 40288]
MEPFVYNARYRVVICKTCGFACVSNEVPTHLRNRHRQLPSAQRKDIAETIANLPDIRRNQNDLLDFQLPPPNSPPIPHLAAPQTDGYKCPKCPYIVRAEKKKDEHYRTVHLRGKSRGRGRPKLIGRESGTTPEPEWRANVHCQRFFLSRLASSWFEVSRKTVACKIKHVHQQQIQQPEVPRNLSPKASLHIQEIIARHEKHMATQNQPRHYAMALGEESLAATSPWLERTRWPKIYRNTRRDILHAMTRLPVREPGTRTWKDFFLGQGPREEDADIISRYQDEQKLACVGAAIDLMLDRCENTARNTSRLVRSWLLSSKRNTYQPRVFTVMTEPSTRTRYRSMWKRFILFVLRAYLMSSIARQQVKAHIPKEFNYLLKVIWDHRVWDGIDTEKGKWPSTTDQRYLTASSLDNRFSDEDIQGAEYGDWGQPDDDDEFEELEEEEIEDGEEDQSEESDHYQQEDPEDATTPYDSPSMSNDSNVTNQGAAEMEFLELLFKLSISVSTQPFLDGQPGSTLLVYFSGIFGFSSDCRQFKLARQYCPSLSGLIYCQRLIYLEYALPLYAYPFIGIDQRPRTQQLEHLRSICDQYIVAGSPTAIAELISLRNFGYMTAKTEPPTYFLRWSDDGQSVSWGDMFTLTMSAYRQLVEHFISRAERLCDELMYGWKPQLRLSEMKDDLTNTRPGYSFMAHPSNNLADAYKSLLAYACTCRGASLHALTGHGQWRWSAVREYLKKTEDLDRMTAGGLASACGQAVRIRELFSVEYENSPTSQRGIFFWNGKMLYVIRHHKAKRITNHEFHVARFLPARLAMVLTKSIVYIRRVADILRREQHGYGSSYSVEAKPLLFQSNGKPWPISRMTIVFRAASTEVLGFKITPQMHRQITIGMTERHVREVHKPFNRYDDVSADADLNVVFSWQSGHRPLQRGVTYGLDGAFPHQLQPSLLRAYEWASTRWHEFIHQASIWSVALGNELQTYHGQVWTVGGAKGQQSDTRDVCYAELTSGPVTGTKVAQTSDASIQASVRLPGLACILPEHRVLICLLCKAAVRPGAGVESHFRHEHRTKGSELAALKQLCSGWWLDDPATMAPLDDGTRAIPELRIQSGYSCKICIFRTISWSSNKAHSRTHGLREEQTWKEVELQTWLRGNHVRYWYSQWIRAKAGKNNQEESEDEAAKEERRSLTLLGESLDREVDRCSWRLDCVPKDTLQCLHGIEAGKPKSKPFGYTAQERSQRKYQAVAHRYLGFCWRAYQMGRQEAEDKLAMFFTDEQWSLMGDVIRELQDVQPGSRAQAPGDEQNDLDDRSNDGNSDYHAQPLFRQP